MFSVAGLLVAGGAQADPPRGGVDAERLKLEWVGSQRCRPEHDVLEGVRRLVGGDPNGILTRSYVVVANVQQLPAGWGVTLSTKGPAGPVVRRFDIATCDEVARAMALVISIWVQPGSEPSEHDDSPKELQLAPMRGESHESLRDASPPRSTGAVGLVRRDWRVLPKRRWDLKPALGVMVLSGALPESGWAITGRIGIAVDSFRCDVLLVRQTAQHLWISPDSLGARFALTATGIRIAWALPVNPSLTVQPGIWTMLGALRGEGAGAAMDRSTPSNDGWGAAGIGIEAHLRLGVADLIAGGGNGLPFGRPRFFVGDSLLYRTPPVTWFGHLLGGFSFP